MSDPNILNSANVGKTKIIVDDLLIKRCIFYEDSIHPENLITIQDANSPAWSRNQPESLIKIRRISYQKYNCIKMPIRCGDCGKRKSQQELNRGRCNTCSKKYWESYIYTPKRGDPYGYPDDWYHFNGTAG